MRVALSALLMLLSPVAAEVTVHESADQVTITNPHLVAVFSRARGGFLDSLRTREGQPLLGGSHVYTDFGIYAERFYVGTACETTPTITIKRNGTAVVVRAEGLLRPDKPRDLGKPQLAYLVEYRIEDSPAIKVSWRVTPDADKPDVDSAFFAHLLSCPSFSQWFAHTADGVVVEEDRGCGQRTYQSAIDPLDLDDPWVGVLTREGKVLVFSDLKASPPFGNVFFHEGSGGSTALFFAWVSGPPGHPLRRGVPWTGAFSLTVCDSLPTLSP